MVDIAASAATLATQQQLMIVQQPSPGQPPATIRKRKVKFSLIISQTDDSEADVPDKDYLRMCSARYQT
jgi:hypothetical protein